MAVKDVKPSQGRQTSVTQPASVQPQSHRVLVPTPRSPTSETLAEHPSVQVAPKRSKPGNVPQRASVSASPGSGTPDGAGVGSTPLVPHLCLEPLCWEAATGSWFLWCPCVEGRMLTVQSLFWRYHAAAATGW